MVPAWTLELLQLYLVLCVYIHLCFHFTSQSSIYCCKCLLIYCGLLKQSQDLQISPGLCPHHHLFIQSSWYLTSAFIFSVCLTPSALHCLVCLKIPWNSDSSTAVTVLNFVWLNVADEPRLQRIFYVFLCPSLTPPKHQELCVNSISKFLTVRWTSGHGTLVPSHKG